MAAKKDDLFELVKSLKGNEIRSFKLYAIKHTTSGSTNYIELFDYLSSQAYYDDNLLKEHFNNAPFINRIRPAKNYLYKLILESLRAYYANHSLEIKVKALLIDVEVLFTKGLLKQAKKVLKQCKKLVNDALFDDYILVIIRWEDFIDSVLFRDNPADSKVFSKEISNSLKSLNLKNDCLNLLYKASNFQGKYQGSNRVNNALRSKLFNQIEQAIKPELDDITKMYCYMAILILSKGSKKFIKEARKLESLVRKYSASKLAQGSYAGLEKFIGAADILSHYYLTIKEFQKSLEITEILKRIIFKNQSRIPVLVSTVYKCSSFNAQLSIYKLLEEYDTAERIISSEVKPFLEEVEITNRIDYQLSYLYQNIAGLYFRLEKYDLIITWITPILKLAKKIAIYSEGRYAFIMIYYYIARLEEGDYLYLNNNIQKAIKQISAFKFNTDWEAFILKYISEVAKDPTQKKDTNKKYSDNLLEVLKADKQKKKRLYTPLETWLRKEFSKN